jgi:thioredoxin 1
MNKIVKIAIVLILMLVVGAVIALKENKRADSETKTLNNPVENAAVTEIQAVETGKTKEVKALPRLVDLGADKCIPCKMMAPILEKLKKEYAGIFKVEFIDVWKNPNAGKKYGIRIIPTQIFFDIAGKELFRHEGFFSREDILAKWKELSVDIEKTRE